MEPVQRRYGDTRHGGANKRVTVAVDEALPFPGVSNLLSKHKMLGGGGGKVSRPCARLLTTRKMLPPSLANISFDTRAVSVSPPLPDPRTLSNAIWHLASAGSMLTHAALWHPRESGPTIRRGPSIGIHFTQANSAGNSNNIRARAGGDGSSRLLRHMLAWTKRGVLHMYGDKRGAQIGR